MPRNSEDTIKRHLATVDRFMRATGRKPSWKYDEITDPDEKKAAQAIRYIRKYGTGTDKQVLRRLLAGGRENDTWTDEEFKRKFLDFLRRNKTLPKTANVNAAQRRIANYMYNATSGKKGPELQEWVKKTIERYGMTITRYRTFEENLLRLENFMARNHYFPKMNMNDRVESDLLNFAVRTKNSGDKEKIDKIIDLVIRYDWHNTCKLFID